MGKQLVGQYLDTLSDSRGIYLPSDGYRVYSMIHKVYGKNKEWWHHAVTMYCTQNPLEDAEYLHDSVDRAFIAEQLQSHEISHLLRVAQFFNQNPTLSELLLGEVI